ncbi:MAG TPA: PhzF family phenazine biosynthesis protein [Candidatus Limnocylindria bacterium]|jgi:predicted PhzF superfamily epimerase YddE/YHI9|nr:PhzF family phenazine biosynthesis protein [Candidatus Limnocylindria bacterium]
MNIPLYVADAFASERFRGNPAAICLAPASATETWMQQVAAEMNLSETAFLSPAKGGGWSLRWFTPVAEVPLCGHATLASAHILWETKKVPFGDSIEFHTKSGVLTCRQGTEGIVMDFPSRPAAAASPPEGLSTCLGCDFRWTGRTGSDWLVEVSHAGVARGLRPDFGALSRLPLRGVIVTARSDTPDYDFISRFFVPSIGIPEDPVTGSAHCALAPYWAPLLGKLRMKAWQASARGGEIGVELAGQRVILSGKAITIWRGELL